MKTFKVRVERTVKQYVEVEVGAPNLDIALNRAEAEAQILSPELWSDIEQPDVGATSWNQTEDVP